MCMITRPLSLLDGSQTDGVSWVGSQILTDLRSRRPAITFQGTPDAPSGPDRTICALFSPSLRLLHGHICARIAALFCEALNTRLA